ncbi:MAG: hypothetical protein ACRDZS_00495 [Acidimicrobiales bacterium]
MPHVTAPAAGGVTVCQGRRSARVEGQVALGSPAARFPELGLLTERPSYRDHFVLRGLDELRVAVS